MVLRRTGRSWGTQVVAGGFGGAGCALALGCGMWSDGASQLEASLRTASAELDGGSSSSAPADVVSGDWERVLGSSGQSVSCLSNLRQIMMAFHIYAGDNKQRLPDPAATEQSWESLLRPYLHSREAYHCSSDGGLFDNLRSSYDWRDTPDPATTVAGKLLIEIRRPDAVFVFDALPEWHGKGKINSAQADGSAMTMNYQDCLKDLDRPINTP